MPSENIKPSFTKKLKFQSVLEGEPLELKCKLVAFPLPTILWFHNNKSIPKTRRRRIRTDSQLHMHSTTLVIDSIKEKDSGSYKVMAINTEGSAESTASLLVSMKEEQPANYLSTPRRTAKAHRNVDSMAEPRRERKFRVDLRCVGSPFDKISKAHRGKSRSQTSLVRSVYFRSGSHSKEKESEKKSTILETASERAPSPPPMFDRSERFNDRFSDIYCDRRTGARFSDRFSDRCSDRYSERFSDTDSLHNEVRAKLTTLQKAVKQKKRLSISTMSSSEFESESVASESSYTDYVERLRVKPAPLSDVHHFNRPFDLGETHREFQGKTTGSIVPQPRVRHSFEPQSRTRAIQIMRGELVDTLVDKNPDSFDETSAGAGQMVSERQSVVADKALETSKVEVEPHHPEGMYSGTSTYPQNTAYSESIESVGIKSPQEGISPLEPSRSKPTTFIPSEALISEDRATTETIKVYEEECAGESLRTQYEKSLEAERKECEEKLLALRIRKWQQGGRMTEEEAFSSETHLPIQEGAQYMEPGKNISSEQVVVEESRTVGKEVMAIPFHRSPKLKTKLEDSEVLSSPKTPLIDNRGDETGMYTPLPSKLPTMESREMELEVGMPVMPEQKSPRIKARATELKVEVKPRVKVVNENIVVDSPGPRQVQCGKEKFLSQSVIPDEIASGSVEPYQEKFARESLRAQYEKSLEAERLQCEEKLLALRIRKWQQGMQMDTPYPESDLPMPGESRYMEPGGQICTQQEAVEKSELLFHADKATSKSPKVRGEGEQFEASAPLPKDRMRARPKESEVPTTLIQKSPKIKVRASKVEPESSPQGIARAEKMLFEKSKEECELQLSRENISEFKNESEMLVSEEEALAQRIMKWQQDVLLEQEQSVQLQPDWVEGYSPLQAGRTNEVGSNVTEASAPKTILQPNVVTSSKPSAGKTAKEKFLMSDSLAAGFHDQHSDSLQWLPTSELLTEGRETRLQSDSEYFVSEEEALAQRILKWQEDVEQEEVAELESEWALDSQPPCTGLPLETHVPSLDLEPQHGEISHKTHPGKLPDQHVTPISEALPIKPSPRPHAAQYMQSPLHEYSSKTSHVSTRTVPPHSVDELTETSYDLKSTVKDDLDQDASPVQIYSRNEVTSVPFEEYKLQKPSKELSSTKRQSLYHSPQEDFGKKSRDSQNKYTVPVDKSSSQCFQSDVGEETPIMEEMGAIRELRQQRAFEGVESEERNGMSFQHDKVNAKRFELRKDSNLKEGICQTQESKIEQQEETSVSTPCPFFVKEISAVKVKIGEMSEFTCQFHGDPLPTVTWLKDGHPLAHNPDYDISSRANKSQLTVFYPTRDHEGSYSCVITNKHGKSICSGTLEISDKKVPKKSGTTKKVVVTQDLDKDEKNQEAMIEKELSSYMDSGKATLQVPQAQIHRHRCSDDTFSPSPVEIRITAATPVPMAQEESLQDEPQAFTGKSSNVSTDEGSSQTVRHKFTFSFDVAGEAPLMVTELNNITCPEGNTALLECAISGEPTPEVTWYYNNDCLIFTPGKYRVEVADKVYKLYINSFTYSDAGVYKCVARNKQGEVSSISNVSVQDVEPPASSAETGKKPAVFDQAVTTYPESQNIVEKNKPLTSQASSIVAVKAKKSRPDVSREPLTLSGCGLPASGAVIKVSQIKQAFEPDSPVSLLISPCLEEEQKETLFPEEFIPAVEVSLDLQNQELKPLVLTKGCDVSDTEESDSTQNIVVSEKSASPLPLAKPAHPNTIAKKGAALQDSHDALQHFVEKVPESPELVRSEPQKPTFYPKQTEAGELELAREEAVCTFDRTSSFIPFQSEKVCTVKRTVRASVPVETAVKSKRTSEPSKPERPRGFAKLSTTTADTDLGSVQVPFYTEEASVVEDLSELNTLTKQNVKGICEEVAAIPEEHHVSDETEPVTIPEPSLDSGVFFSMSDSLPGITELAEGMADNTVEHHTQNAGRGERINFRVQPEPKTLTASSEKEGSIRQVILPKDGAADVPQSQDTSVEEKVISEKASGGEARRAAATFGSLEEEEVTFGAVYDYYNPPTDWGRPLSPESEMSIEIGSTVSEEIAEVAERFYTPGSSTEVSQPIAESFYTPKSPMSFHTPSSDTPGGFSTPQEYPFSPLEYKRPSTGESSERFFSPLQFLTSPADEGIETTPPVDDKLCLSKGRGLLSLPTLQEKVQGIPPAFLKPLIKKRVFENDSLTFYAEVFGLPSPEVKWFCNKTQLLADERVKIERDGDCISMTILNVTKADQGEYICEAVNYVGEARSVALVVVVSQEVRFMPAPPAVTHQHVMEFDVEEDDSSRSPSPQEILLEVELDENEVKEFEKQVKIITIPEYTADNKSMIISLDVLPSIYEEGAVDFVTQEHDDLKIAFEVTEMPPRFINPICDMETPEGTTVMFECSLMGIPSPIVSWFKGDKKIPHNNKKYFHSSDGDNHFLKICKVSTLDSGVYTCRAINIVGETLCRASLVVLNAKTFSGKTRGRELTAVSLGSAKVQPQKFDMMVGNTSFDGEQVSEIELEFEFEQEQDESQRAVRLVANTDNEMSDQGEKYVSINFDVFAEPAKEDKVEFKGKSSEMCSFQFQVTETAPKCIIPLTNVTAAVGTPVILQCLVSGKPNPTAEWYKDGNRVTDSRCIIQEKTAGHFNLLITNVTQSDAGEYKCIIQNTAGCIETTALLKVF